MAILNYTTEISASKTVAEIQGMLVRFGARKLLTDYDEAGNPTGIEFLLETQWGPRGYRLPANIDAVYAVLVKQANARKIATRYSSREQAARVGWRILKDWVEAQLAILETEMVQPDQVLMPFLVAENGYTLYEVMSGYQMLLPPPKA